MVVMGYIFLDIMQVGPTPLHFKILNFYYGIALIGGFNHIRERSETITISFNLFANIAYLAIAMFIGIFVTPGRLIRMVNELNN